jgi:hypothetical protein
VSGKLFASRPFAQLRPKLPQIQLNWPAALVLSAATVALLLLCGLTLYRTTRSTNRGTANLGCALFCQRVFPIRAFARR